VSHPGALARLKGMQAQTTRQFLWALVLGHFVITLVHGAAHALASVPMSAAANSFILLVIEAGPLAGLWLSRRKPAAGASVVAATMTGALVFGVVNHFMIAGADHVAHIVPEWRSLFATTAALLGVTEAGAIAAAVSYRRALLGADSSVPNRAFERGAPER
jgi:hypothetical protein